MSTNMSFWEDRWDNRVRWARNQVIGFDGKEDVVFCRRHEGAQPYSKLLDSAGWWRVCHECVKEHFRELVDPIPEEEETKEEARFVCCFETCLNDALETLQCNLCNNYFCVAHMSDDKYCDTCLGPLDDQQGE